MKKSIRSLAAPLCRWQKTAALLAIIGLSSMSCDPFGMMPKADFTTNWNASWGSSGAEDVAGAVIDNSGNIYVTGATNPDGYQGNVFLAKVNYDTKAVVWSKSFDAGAQDYMPSPGENGHSQG